MPTFSIIVPSYNSADTVKRCLESILAQDLNDYELIAINDGSTDQTGAILEYMANADRRVRVIHNKTNQGVSNARNKGIDVSQGDYILFIDSDDYIGHGYLRSIYNEIRADLADIYIWGITKLINNAGSKVISPHCFSTFDRVGFLSSFLPYQQSSGIYGFVANKAVKRDLVEKNGIRFNTNLHLLEDYDFFLSCYKFSERITIFPLFDYFYVLPAVSMNSISRIDSVDYKSLIEVHQKCRDIFKEIGIKKDEHLHILDKTISDLVVSAFLEMPKVSHAAINNLLRELNPWIPVLVTDESRRTGLIQRLINNKSSFALSCYMYMRQLYHLISGHNK